MIFDVGDPESQDIKLADDYMFKSVFSDLELCKRLIELVLDVQIDHVEFLTSEHAMKFYSKSRGAAIDLRVTLDDGTLVDVEMQKKIIVGIERKARFYHAMLDIDGTLEGTKLRDMHDSYVIFFCLGDPFGSRRAYYTFRNTCDEVPGLALRDGQVKVFVNVMGDMTGRSERFSEFCRYLSGDESNIEDEFVLEVHELVARLRTSTDWRHERMFIKDIVDDYADELMAKGREEGLAAGREEGLAAGREEAALRCVRSLMASQRLPASQAAEILGLDEETARRVAAAIDGTDV